MLAFRHDRTDHLAAVGCNLSCESNAFQGDLDADEATAEVIGLNLSCESNAFQGFKIAGR